MTKRHKFLLTAEHARERREEPKRLKYMKPDNSNQKLLQSGSTSVSEVKPPDFTRFAQDIKKLKRKILRQSCVNLWLNGFNTIPLRTLRPLRLNVLRFICVLVFLCAFAVSAFAQEGTQNTTEIAGEFFGTPVPVGNYYFVKGAIMVFGNQWGPQPTTAEELENCVWDELLLSYEAFRRDIQVSQQELEEEITKTLEADKVDFDWKKDKDTYNKWVKERTNEPSELFENQLKHLIQLKKLRQQVMDNIEPQVREDEAYQEFLNEHNTLGIELVQFDEKKDAENFYKKAASKPDFWEEEKNKRPQDFKRPGFVALEFLMDMWKLPKEAVYKMMEMEIGEIHQPTPIYKGYGVFKILEKRAADKSMYPQLMNSYYEQIKLKKKYEGLNEWFKDLKERANIKIYSTEISF